MWPTWSNAFSALGEGDEFLGLGQSVAASGFSTIVAMPRSRKAPATSRCRHGGHGDRDGVDLVEQGRDSRQRPRSGSLGDGPRLLGPGVGHADQLDSGQAGEDPRVVLPQMADTDHRRHAVDRFDRSVRS